MTTTQRDWIKKAFEKVTVLRTRDLASMGLSRVVISQAARDGTILRVGYGLYSSPDAELTEKNTCVLVAKAVPNAVFCLLTACRLHDITRQNPREVWFAIGPSAWRPRIDFVGTRVIRLSGKALSEGVETIEAEGVPLRVYCVAKTVADLFKYRNKYGLDVAIEALRDALAQRKCSVADIMHYARICRVARVIEPYITTLLSS
jgi:predicted transcriptional regulator of viral defense system